MMEGQKFTSDSLNNSSPKLLQCFQADRFLKSTNNLNIPDTIPELSSTELSGSHFKMEKLKTPTNEEDKENLVNNLSFKSDESSASTIIAVDNSFLVKCEKKLLENSISDSERFLSVNKSIKNENFSELSKKLGLSNETISTPTHILRKQISILKNEIAESDEFHDLEIKILKEEKHEFNGEDLPYEQVIEKYSALLDLYTSLKNEYDEYRREQEKLQYKTADCLESLCSQIEASDSSLNFSSASFASFNTDIKSSTMMNNISEVEATVVNDATLQDVDPLAATQEKIFKTPVHLPFKSSKKLFLQESSCNKTKRTPCVRAENSLDDGTIQMLTLKTADKVKEVEDLEQRLIKVEDFVSTLQSENERLKKEYSIENKKLKDDLMKKTEQFEELTKKLFTETISLNPALKETLTNASGTKLLTVFIETIMESCKSIQDDLVRKFYSEKEDWESQRKSLTAKIVDLENQIKMNDQESHTSQFENLKKQYDDLKNQMQEAEKTITIRNEEIRLLQSHDSGIRKTREDLALANEAVAKLEAQLSAIENEKQEIEKRYQELEEVTQTLREEINSQRSTILSHERENESLKTSLQQSEEIVEKFKSNLMEKEDSSETEELTNKEVSLRNEILKIFKETKEVFTDFLPEFYNESTETLLKSLNEFFDVKYGNSDIISAFSETIFTCCEKVKENLNKTFESNKAELLNQIEDLRNELNVIKSENEVKISEIMEEKESYKKLNESLNDKLAELETEESQVKVLREELTKTEEVLIKLKSQIISIEGEKVEMENRCSDLEKTNAELQILISTKETIIKDLENSIEIIQKDLNAAKEINEKLEESKMESLSKLNDFALTNEAVKELEIQLSAAQNEKEEIQKRYQELEEVTQTLKDEINSQKSLILSHEQENESLKTSLQETQEIAEKLKTDLETLGKQDSSEMEELRNEILRMFKECNEVVIDFLPEFCNEKTETTSNPVNDIFKDKYKNSEIVSVFSETIFNCCEKVRENLNKTFETNKAEFLIQIEDLKNDINEIKAANEVKISEVIEEKENYMKLKESLEDKLANMESEASQVTALRGELSETKEDLIKLKSQIESFEGEKVEMENRCSDLEKTNAELQSLIASKETIIKDLENSIDNIQKELEAVRESNKILEESKMESLSELTNEAVKELETQLSDAQKEKEEVTQTLEKTNEELQTLINTKETVIKDLESSIETIQKELETVKESNKTLEESKTESLSNVDDLTLEKETVAKLESQLSAVQNEKEEIQKRYQELEEVTQTLEKTNAELQTLITTKETIIKDLESSIETIQKELEAARESNKMLEESKMESLVKLNDLASEKEAIAKLESQLSTVENEKEEIGKRHQELEELTETLEKTNAELRTLVTTKETVIKDLEISLETAQKELETAKESNKMLEESKMESLSKLNDLALTNEAVKELETQLLATQIEKEEIQKRYQELEEITETLREEINSQKSIILSHEQENEGLKASLQQSEEVIEKLKSDLQCIEKQDSSEKEELRNEMLKIFKESNEVLTDFLPEFCKESSESILKTLSDVFEVKYGGSDIVSAFSETIFTCCEKVKENLNKTFETNKAEFLIQIEDLKNDINEIKSENEVKMSEIIAEKENYKKLNQSLEDKLAELESKESQVNVLREELSETKEDLVKLKSQIISFVDEKVEIEKRWSDMEKTNLELQTLTATKETIIRDLENSVDNIQKELEAVRESNKMLEESKMENLVKLNDLALEKEAIAKLESQLLTVENEKEEIGKRHQELEEVAETLEKTNAELRTLISTKETVIKDLESSLETIRNELEAARESNKMLEESRMESLSKLNDLALQKETIAKLESQLLAVENEKEEMGKRHQELEEIVENLEKTNTELRTSISNKETVIKNLENSLETIQKELESARENNKILEESKMESLSKLNDLALQKETVATLEAQLLAAQNEKEEIQKHYQELEEVTQTLKDEIKSQKSLILSHEQENEGLKTSLQESQEIAEKLKSDLEIIEKQHSSEAEDLRNKEVSLRNEILRMFKECNEVPTDFLGEFCKEKTETAPINNFFKDEYNNSDIVSTFIETITTCCSKIKEDLNKTFEANKAEFIIQIEGLRNDINEIKAENEMKMSEIIEERENYKKLNECLDDKMAEMKEDLSKLKSQIENVECEKVEIEKRYSDLEITNTELQSLVSTKETVIKDLESSVEVVQKDLESAKELNEKLEKSKLEDVAKLDEELKEVRTKTEELLGENNSLKEKNNGFNTLLNVLEELFDFEKFVKMSAEELSEMFNEKVKSNSDFALLHEVLETLECAFRNQYTKTKEVVNELKDYKNSYNEALKCLEDSQQNILSNSGDLNISEILNPMEISSDNKIVSVFKTTVKDTCELVKNQMVRMFENEKRELEEQQRIAVRELDLELKSLKDENNEIIEILEECRKRMENEVVEPFSENLCDLVAHLPNENQIISLMTSIIIIVTKNIEDELCKKFSAKKNELEKQRKVDLSLINDLQNQIKEFEEKNSETNCLQDRILEVENSLSTLSEEFKAQKQALEKTEENLAAAEGTIVKLKSQLRTIKTEKLEIITRCQQLEEDAAALQTDIDTKDTILKGFEEIQSTKQKIENENSELKERLLQSEEIIGNLKVTLQNTKEEQSNKELEWKKEMDLLKSEKEDLAGLTDKVEKLEENKKQLVNVLSDIQSFLEMPKDIVPKLLSGELENEKIFTERISNFTKSELDSLKMENKNLKCGNENLKEKVKELNKMIIESDKKENCMLDNSVQTQSGSRGKSGRKSDLCARKLDKLEEINQNLTELLTGILTETDFPNLEKLKFCSARDYPNIKKQVMAHVESLESKIKELTADNCKLDEECDSYAQTIKDLQKEAVKAWKTNKTKLEALETELGNAREEKKAVEKEKEELVSKISKLENEVQKLKSNSKSEGSTHSCNCGTDSKKMNELKRTLLIKEQKILELQDVENQNAMYKSQIKYLETAVQQERKKINEEKEKSKKLENELKEMKKNQKVSDKNAEDNQMLEQLRMGGSLAGGVVQELVDKEKMRKLAKDIGILKELCRARYAEIKRLETENAALRTLAPKNPNQMDSPVRTRSYNTRSKNLAKDMWKPETEGKENSVLL